MRDAIGKTVARVAFWLGRRCFAVERWGTEMHLRALHRQTDAMIRRHRGGK